MSDNDTTPTTTAPDNQFPIHISDELLSDPNYTRKTVTLPSNGRVISYSECGNLESGHPVLFHMGLMGSSLAVIAIHKLALQCNLRVICLDYPGIGESTPVPDRTLLQWGIDVEDFCRDPTVRLLAEDQKFTLLGHCLGVPHTLAIWSQMMTRIDKVVLVAPWVGDTETNPWWMRNVLQRLPLPYLPYISANLLATTTYLNYPFSYLVGADLKKLLRAVHEIHAYNRHQGNGGNQEMVRLALESSDKAAFWDPILTQISTAEKANVKNTPVHVWHGSNDAMVSKEACQRFVSWLTDMNNNLEVTFTSIDKADHNTILMDVNHMATILETIGSQGNSTV